MVVWGNLFLILTSPKEKCSLHALFQRIHPARVWGREYVCARVECVLLQLSTRISEGQVAPEGHINVVFEAPGAELKPD